MTTVSVTTGIVSAISTMRALKALDWMPHTHWREVQRPQHSSIHLQLYPILLRNLQLFSRSQRLSPHIFKLLSTLPACKTSRLIHRLATCIFKLLSPLHARKTSQLILRPAYRIFQPRLLLLLFLLLLRRIRLSRRGPSWPTPPPRTSLLTHISNT